VCAPAYHDDETAPAPIPLLSRAVKLGRRLPLIGRCFSRLRLQLHAWRARLGAAYAIAGRTEEAKRLLREWEQASADEREGDVEHWALALIYLKLGNKDHAFEWPEKGFKARSTTPFVVKVYPFFDEMTSDRGSKS